MTELLSQINLHEFLTGAVIGAAITWVLSALAWALPKPEEIGSLWYRTLYRLLQFAVANLPAARKPLYPADPSEAGGRNQGEASTSSQ